MKKILKKIFLTIKRGFIKVISVLFAFIVFISSFAVPSLAVDADFDESHNYILRPFFNWDYIEIEYILGDDLFHYETVLFSLKDCFYDIPIERVLVVDPDETVTVQTDIHYSLIDLNGSGREASIFLSNARFHQYTTTISGQSVRVPFWQLQFYIPFTNDISRLTVGCSESIYDFGTYGGHNMAYDEFAIADARGFAMQGYDNALSSFYDGYFYYPKFYYDKNDSISGRQLLSHKISHEMQGGMDTFSLTPFYDINNLRSMMPDYQYGSPMLYFSDFTVTYTFDELLDDDAKYLLFNICYIPEDKVPTFKQYHDKYFPAYRFESGAVDFTGWLSTALSGFLSFEFVPGISFTMLLYFFIGVGCFVWFLKFFAGG